MNYGSLESNDDPNHLINENLNSDTQYTKENEPGIPAGYRYSNNTPYGTTGEGVQFLYDFPNDFNILKDAQNVISQTEGDVKVQIEIFISSLQNTLLTLRNSLVVFPFLPPLSFRLLEDKSVLIEWLFKDFRIGFAIEHIKEDSSWYLVSNSNLNEVSMSGSLLKETYEQLFTDLLPIALSNS